MKITVELFGDLRRFLSQGQDRLELELDDGVAVAEIYARLGIPQGDIYGASVNGEWADAQRRLAEGDLIFLFPPMVGGGLVQGGFCG